MGKAKLEINGITEMLLSSKISDRKKGVKLIQGNKIKELGSDLFELLQKEMDKGKSWELITMILDTLGILKFASAETFLLNICKINEEHDMITISASGAYFRVSKDSVEDVKPLFELLSFGKFAVIDGALEVLGLDKIVPERYLQGEIIEKFQNLNFRREKGYSDIRIGLALACAGWEKSNVVNSFLDTCIQSDYTPLQKVAMKSKKGQYSSL